MNSYLRTFALIACGLLEAASAVAADVALTWKGNNPPGAVDYVIYQEQEADPELFDLPFLSADPDLVERVAREPEYRARLERDLSTEARGRARRR